MEYNQTLVRKRTRITNKTDLSLFSASLLNRLEAACRNSRDPVKVLSIGGNIYIEDGVVSVKPSARKIMIEISVKRQPVFECELEN